MASGLPFPLCNAAHKCAAQQGDLMDDRERDLERDDLDLDDPLGIAREPVTKDTAPSRNERSRFAPPKAAGSRESRRRGKRRTATLHGSPRAPSNDWFPGPH